MSFLYSAVKAGIEAHRDFNNSGPPTPLMREMRQPKRSLIYGPAYDLVTYLETKTRGKRVTPFVDGAPISPAGSSSSDVDYGVQRSSSTTGAHRRAPALSEIIGQPIAPPVAQAPTESPTLFAPTAPPVMSDLPTVPQSQSRASTPIPLVVDTSGPSTSVSDPASEHVADRNRPLAMMSKKHLQHTTIMLTTHS